MDFTLTTGWKTYLGAAIVALAAVGTYLNWFDSTTAQTILGLGAAFGLVGMRHAISTETKKVAGALAVIAVLLCAAPARAEHRPVRACFGLFRANSDGGRVAALESRVAALEASRNIPQQLSPPQSQSIVLMTGPAGPVGPQGPAGRDAPCPIVPPVLPIVAAPPATPVAPTPQIDPAMADILKQMIAQKPLQQVIPYAGHPQQVIPYAGPPQQVIPYTGPPQQVIPYAGPPQQAIPYQGAPQQIVPYQGAPQQPVPFQGAPQQNLIPQGGAPQQSIPLTNPVQPQTIPQTTPQTVPQTTPQMNPGGPQQQLNPRDKPKASAPGGYNRYAKVTYALYKR